MPGTYVLTKATIYNADGSVGPTGMTIRKTAELTTNNYEFVESEGTTTGAVLIILGVNDTLELTRGTRWTSALGALVSELAPRARAIVFSGVPPLGELVSLPQPTWSALGARAAYLDALLERSSAAHGAHYVPIRSPFPPEHLARDGFHPSALGYAAWADELASAWPA